MSDAELPESTDSAGLSAASIRATAANIGRPAPRNGVRTVFSDAWVEATRHLRVIPRYPELMVFAALQPLTILVLTTLVLGNAVEVDGFDDYKQFLIPGALAQAVVLNTAFTSIGIAEDMEKGYMDRLRSLPMSRAAVLIGRTASDFIRNAITFLICVAASVLIGFEFGGSALEIAGGTVLLMYFSYALTWIQVLIGLSVGTVESANSAGFIWMFPATFVSSVYVDPSVMPGWLEPVARLNPVTYATDAVRELYNGGSAGIDIWYTLVWSTCLILGFGAISIGRFSRSTAG